MFIKKDIFYYLILFFVLSFGIYVRFVYYYDDGLWSDEWISFFLSNPKASLYEIYQNHIKYEGTPPIILLFNLFWSKLLGHYYQSIEIGSAIISSATLLISFFFFDRERIKNLFFLFLVSINPFLIYYSGEVRFYSVFCFFSLISIIFFFFFVKKKNYINIFFFTLFNFIALSLSLYFISIFLSYIIFILYKKKNLLYLFILLIIFFFFIIFNFQYLSNIINLYHGSGASSALTLGFFFNIFFADKILGGFFLLLLIFSFFFYRKQIINNDKILLLSIIIFFSYFVPIFYAVFKSQILFPRHLIFIIIPIIYLSVNFIFNFNSSIRNVLIILLIFYSIFINFYKNKPYILTKPNPNKIIDHIEQSNIFSLYVPKYVSDINQNLIFNNKFSNLSTSKVWDLYSDSFFLYSKNFNKKINFINEENFYMEDAFWKICLNNPSFRVGKNYTKDDPTCFNNKFDDLYYIFKVIKDSEFLLIQYKKIK